MGVDSYLEVYTTLYGWYFSGVILRTLMGTGIYLLPVLFMMVAAYVETHADGLDGDGATRLVRRIEQNLWITIFMFYFCVYPNGYTSLSRINLSYTPPATVINPTPVTVTGANTQSTYDTMLGDRADVAAVPPWWMMVMSVSGGVTSAIRADIQNGMADIRTLEYIAASTRITDFSLRNEIQRFYSDCFVPARSRFRRTLPPSPEAAAALTTYGNTDVDWIGSHVFRDDPNLYGRYWASEAVVGFVFDPSRYADSDLNASEAVPIWGRPSCKQWWEEDTIGLRARMVQHVGWPVGSPTQLGTAIANMWPLATAEERADALARLAYVKEEPKYVDPQAILGSDRRWYDSAAAAPSELAGVAGTTWEWFKVNSSMMPIINLLLMAQPLILMGIYVFLPAAVIFSGYSLRMFVTGALAIFTVKFWIVMWTIARWLDDRLVRALNEPDLFWSLLDIADHTFKRMILNALLVGMFIALPLLWTGMMAWAGHRIGGAMDGWLGMANRMGDRAGAAGASMAVKGAKK